MAVKVNKIIRHDGEFYYPDDVIFQIKDAEAKRLVKKGLAQIIDIEEVEETSTNAINELNHEETLEEVLDLNFNTDELKVGAKEQGLNFKANISKKDLIALIAEENAENYFLDQLED